MSGMERARRLLQDAGLAFPTIPDELAVKLEERGEWLFSTRTLTMSPYNLQYYVDESDRLNRVRPIDQFAVLEPGDDEWVPGEGYAVLCHSGHGVNSYAIQYYLVYGPLRMFLHLGWGGIYMDAETEAAKIAGCFSLADQIVPAVTTARPFRTNARLMIVGSDFYGSYWSAPGHRRKSQKARSRGPVEVLTEVLQWLQSRSPNIAMEPTARG